jgi:hypothetical protein
LKGFRRPEDVILRTTVGVGREERINERYLHYFFGSFTLDVLSITTSVL